MVIFPDSEAYALRGKCRNIRKLHREGLWRVLVEYHLLPGAPKITVFDLSNFGGCENHPQGSHDDGKTVDLGYPALPGRQVWEGLEEPTGLDHQGLAFLWQRLGVHFPRCQVRTWKAIMGYMKDRHQITVYLVPDENEDWMHWEHMHVNLGEEVC